MRTILKLIVIALIFLFMAGAFLLLINKTFVYETYTEEIMSGDGIPISRFMYYQGRNNNTATFITPLKESYLNTYRNDYMNSLEMCYDTYYYDADNNITILDYSIIDNGYYRTVKISMVDDNYCSEDYVLSDTWLDDYQNSNYVEGEVSKSGADALINLLTNSTRVTDLIINDDYESTINITITCNNGENYTLTFSDYSESSLLVIKNDGYQNQYAVYEVANVIAVLNALS